MQLRLQDWVRLIVPNVKKMEIIEMDKEKLPKVKSSMDKHIPSLQECCVIGRISGNIP